VQFHPTALDAGVDPMPLVTEALRGAGAVIVDEDGCRFLFDHDERGELAPRDVVAIALCRHLRSGRRAYLDARTAVGDAFPVRFPTVFDACRRHGIDPRVAPIPVAPAAHYHMGGVATDVRGRSSLAGLWACGEVACTGVHGANRLASNSLLEGLVFGGRVAKDIAAAGTALTAVPVTPPAVHALHGTDAAVLRRVRRVMWDKVGIERNSAGLREAIGHLDAIDEDPPGAGWSAASDAVLVARAIAESALERRESRGAHVRTDYPAPDAAWARRHFVSEATLRAAWRSTAGARR
jgi:L-aspartate oxidase